jgi:hypothetical protein
LKHLPALALDVLNVLNAATGTLKHFAQDSFALGKRLSPNVFSVVHQNRRREQWPYRH